MKIKSVAARKAERAALGAIKEAAGKAKNVEALRSELLKLIDLVEKKLN